MNTRSAQSQTEIDFLPPFGEPEVVTTGAQSKDVAILGVAAAGALAYALNQ